MIPIHDNNPAHRPPIVTVALIVGGLAVGTIGFQRRDIGR